MLYHNYNHSCNHNRGLIQHGIRPRLFLVNLYVFGVLDIDIWIVARYGLGGLLTPKIIEKFADKWDWHELSDNSNLKLSYALLDKFADKWDWERIVNRWHSEDLYTPDFLERYKEYIPVEEFKDSKLWNMLVEKRFD